MSKLLLIGLMLWVFGDDKINGSGIVDNATFLTGGNKKSWYLYSNTPENSGGCKEAEAVSSDNTYTFSSDGSFEFDHGTITEDASCEDCCTDFVNVIGEWKFTKNQKGLQVTILHEKGNKRNAKKMLMFDASIDQLNEAVLKFSQADKETGTLYAFEFRRK